MATSYANPGGTGDRRKVIAISGTFTHGELFRLINGNTSDGVFNGAAAAGVTIVFDFGNQHVIDEAKWYQSNTDTHGTWKWQGSNDNSSWSDIGSTFTLGGSTPSQTHSELNGNVTAYRWYRLLGVSGTLSSSSSLREVEFRISPPTVAAPATAWETGDRTARITVTKSGGLSGVPTSGLVNGAYGSEGGSGSAVSGQWIQFDFGVPRVADAALWFQNGGETHGTWQWQGSNDASSWTSIGEQFLFPATRMYAMFPEVATFSYEALMLQLAQNRTGYRYYRLLGISGNFNGSPYLQEMEFREGEPGSGGGTPVLSFWQQINGLIDMYRKNTAGQNLSFALVDAATGEALTGSTVSGYRSVDGGTQAAVTGTISEKGNGQYNLALSAADTNGNQVGLLFTATGAVPVNLTIVTTADDPTTPSTAPSASEVATAVWAAAMETGWSALETMRIMLSALAGKVSGANTTSIAFRDVGDSKTRISASVDQYGNRNVVSYDKT